MAAENNAMVAGSSLATREAERRRLRKLERKLKVERVQKEQGLSVKVCNTKSEEARPERLRDVYFAESETKGRSAQLSVELGKQVRQVQAHNRETSTTQRPAQQNQNQVLHKELQDAQDALLNVQLQQQRLGHVVAFPGLGRYFKHVGQVEIKFGDTLATMEMTTAVSAQAEAEDSSQDSADCRNVYYDYTSGTLHWEHSGAIYRGQFTRSEGRNMLIVTGPGGDNMTCVEVVSSKAPSESQSTSKDKRQGRAASDLAWQMDGLKAEQEVERNANLARSKARAEAKPGGAWGSRGAARAAGDSRYVETMADKEHFSRSASHCVINSSATNSKPQQTLAKREAERRRLRKLQRKLKVEHLPAHQGGNITSKNELPELHREDMDFVQPKPAGASEREKVTIKQILAPEHPNQVHKELQMMRKMQKQSQNVEQRIKMAETEAESLRNREKAKANKKLADKAATDLVCQMERLNAEHEVERNADLAESKLRAALPRGAWGSTGAARETRRSGSMNRQPSFDREESEEQSEAATAKQLRRKQLLQKTQRFQAVLSQQLHRQSREGVFSPVLPSQELGNQVALEHANCERLTDPEFESELECRHAPATLSDSEPDPGVDAEAGSASELETKQPEVEDSTSSAQVPVDAVDVENVEDDIAPEPHTEQVDGPFDAVLDDSVDDEYATAVDEDFTPSVVDDHDVNDRVTVVDSNIEEAVDLVADVDGYNYDGEVEAAEEDQDDEESLANAGDDIEHEDDYADEFDDLDPTAAETEDAQIPSGNGVTFAEDESQSSEQRIVHRAWEDAAAKPEIRKMQKQLRNIEQRRKMAEMEAASLYNRELEKAKADRELARQERLRAARPNQQTAREARLDRAKQAVATTTVHGHLGASEQATLRRAAARTKEKEKLDIDATAAAAVEIGGLQPASVARQERAARMELASRNQRRASQQQQRRVAQQRAAQRVEATRQAQMLAQQMIQRESRQEERERRSTRRARVREHVEARQLMETRWAVAKAAKSANLRAVDEQYAERSIVKVHSPRSAALRERTGRLLEELMQQCDETVVERVQRDVENISEEERSQMERNVNADNIAFEDLDTKGIGTLIKYSIVASARSVICRQLQWIANNESDLPEPAEHCMLVRRLSKLADDDQPYAVEALAALHATVAWRARIKQEQQDTDELAVLRKKLQAIADEKSALEQASSPLL